MKLNKVLTNEDLLNDISIWNYTIKLNLKDG